MHRAKALARVMNGKWVNPQTLTRKYEAKLDKMETNETATSAALSKLMGGPAQSHLTSTVDPVEFEEGMRFIKLIWDSNDSFKGVL